MSEYPPPEFWRLKTVTISATAGNVVANKSPSTGSRWIPLYARITLVADANPANRYINCQITDGTNVLATIIGITTAITAGETKSVSYMRGISAGKGDAGTDHAHICLPYIILEGRPTADQFRITITGGLVGDSYSGYIRVLEVDM